MQGALETESKGKAEAIRMKRSLNLMLANWKLLWNMLMLPTKILKRLSRNIINKSGNLKPNWKMSKGPRKLLETTFSPMNEGPILPKMLLKRPELFLNKLIGPEE